MSLSPALEALKEEALRTSCESWAMRKRWVLGPGHDRAGPCPICGGTDRFAINTHKNKFLCRRCGIAGEGVIKLVMLTENVGFTAACEIITGRTAEEPIDPEKAARIAAENRRREQQRAEEADRYRENARRAAYGIWEKSRAAAPNGLVARYLAHRGIPAEELLDPTKPMRLVLRGANVPYRHKVDRSWQTLDSGPAMVAAVIRPDGRFGAVHQTWIDLTQPNGRRRFTDAEGKALPGKKVLGSKKGGAIHLFTPKSVRRIVMGEGIETTLTALAHNFEPDTAYWAGVDLGNMAGRAWRDADGKRYEAEPDLEDVESFVPPAWCEELIYLCDSDEPEKHTVEKVSRGLKRALLLRAQARDADPNVPPLSASYVEPPGDGRDLNDLVMPVGAT